MKQLFVLSLILLLTSVRANNEDMFERLSFLVKDYYYTYFQYPKTTDDLINFAWNGILYNENGDISINKINGQQRIQLSTNLIKSNSFKPFVNEYLYLEANK